ncbi:MAG: DNA polymerase III subunit delta, partial [Lachnospiraceae bacterium]|nr:DNA polymerase III subunit delta [Lachnospiraceae bacterium]
MSGFDKVIGHTQVLSYFQKAIAQDKLAHSYIITGEKGSGKKLLAGLFAKTVQCEAQGTEPCGECRSCKQSDSG